MPTKQDAGGEWRAVVEATRGRRGLVLHLEQLKSWFTAPVLIAVQPNGSFNFSRPAQVNLGMATTQVDFTLGGGVMPDRQSFDGRFTAKHPFCSFEGTLSGKRTTEPARRRHRQIPAVRPFSFHGLGCPLHTSAAATDNTGPSR